MTRINVGIAPQLLTNKHLIAEHREIKRIPNNVANGKCNFNGIPEKFTLGTGHVKFFYNKLLYLKNRYELLYAECRRRGFNVQYYGDAWVGIPEYLMNDYLPTPEDVAIIQQRINEKLKGNHIDLVIIDDIPDSTPAGAQKDTHATLINFLNML